MEQQAVVTSQVCPGLHNSPAGGHCHVPTSELPGPRREWKVGATPDARAQVQRSRPADLLRGMPPLGLQERSCCPEGGDTAVLTPCARRALKDRRTGACLELGKELTV